MQRYSYFLVLVCILVFVSCSTSKNITEHKTVQKDTVYHNTIQRDSVYYHDSIFVMRNGDTTIYKEYHITYKSKGSSDTIRIYKILTDTLYKTKTKIEYKEKEESWWNKTLKRIGLASLIILALVLVCKIKSFL